MSNYNYSSLQGIPSTTIYNSEYMEQGQFIPGPLKNKFYFQLNEAGAKSMCACSNCRIYGCPTKCVLKLPWNNTC